MKPTTNTTRTLPALIFCVAVLASAGAFPASAQGVPVVEDGNPECRAALQDAHDQLLAMKEAGPLDVLGASRLVDDVAGPTCGFSILEGRAPIDAGQLAADVAAVSGPARSEPHSLAVIGAIGNALGTPDVIKVGKVVPCMESGEGAGTITAYILGIVFDEQSAVGQWTGEGGVVHVTGTAALVSGTQASGAGGMFVGPVGPLTSVGNTRATCLETETVTVIEEKCWWLIIYTQCTQKVETKVSLSPCGATAEQDMLGRGLIVYEHSYEVDNNPCDGGSANAGGNAVVVSDAVDVHTVYLTNT